MQPVQSVLSPQVIGEIAASEGATLYRHAHALARNPNDAWDLVQDTFERALRRPPVDLSRDKLKKWLRVTLRNVFIDRHCRSVAARRERLLDNDVPEPTPEPDASPSPWRLVDEADLRRLVDALDPRLREVYLLHAEQHLPAAKIAEILGIPAATVGTRLYRARRRLKAWLEREVLTA